MAKLVVIGPGKMGTALAIAFAAAGHRILAALARNPGSASAKSFTALTQAPVFAWPTTTVADDAEQPEADAASTSASTPAWSDEARRALLEADLILIATPDAAVTPVAQTLAEAKLLQSHQTVVHCSGATPHTALHPLMLQGVNAACMHPLQTIANPEDAPACFAQVVFTLDGTEQAVAMVTALVRAIGGIPERLDPDQRPRYHAAAVLASNAVVALVAVTAGVAELTGGSRPFLPLLQGALRNLEQYGVPEALTGPVERADLETVSRHIIALQDNPTAKRIYLALQSAATDVARRKGSLTPEQWKVFHDLFEEQDNPTEDHQ